MKAEKEKYCHHKYYKVEKVSEYPHQAWVATKTECGKTTISRHYLIKFPTKMELKPSYEKCSNCEKIVSSNDIDRLIKKIENCINEAYPS